MGITYAAGTVSSGEKEEDLRFLVDSGSQYTLLPHEVWTRLGLAPTRTLDFVLADGTVIQRDLSECYIKLPEGQGHTPVILGHPGDDVALLGAFTLEAFALMLNPFTRQLEHMRLMMPGIRTHLA